VVKGAEIPPPFGGKYRQIMVYVDPYKLASRQLSVMDVVNAVNNSNLILPAGRRQDRIRDYYVYSNSLVKDMKRAEQPAHEDRGHLGDGGGCGKAEDANQLQYNIVRVNGQKSAYIPIMKQGGDTNTIEVVNDVRKLTSKLVDIPKQLVTNVVFDQSVYVKSRPGDGAA
jgi:hydrophobic/amphiphilic exporter-1 (mainly G- bacteria), HAE1 family